MKGFKKLKILRITRKDYINCVSLIIFLNIIYYISYPFNWIYKIWENFWNKELIIKEK